MKSINYINGDATAPTGDDNKIIVHICNDIGGWGRGFVMAITKRWKEPEAKYREWHKSGDEFELGAVQFVQVEDDLWIANLIGQHKIKRGEKGEAPIRYDAVKSGLAKIALKAIELNSSVHMPRIGCGLAGGKWEHIEPLLLEELISKGLDVTVYDFA